MRKPSKPGRVVPEPEAQLRAQLDPRRIPTHIAIIMDGNGRWAAQRRLSALQGHQAGKEAVRRVIKACMQLGVKYLTVYAFSTENWARPLAEVQGLMRLLGQSITEELKELNENGVRVRVIGRLDEKLPALLRAQIERAIEQTKQNQRLTFTVALNYGGRAEIIDAAKHFALAVARGLDPQSITEEAFRQFLYTNGTPDPDLVIRTGGEMRLSNFLLWQLAYAEFWSTKTYWPDFDSRELLRAITEYQRRVRRFGSRPPALAA